jgi:hypothetical protein
MMSYCRWSSDDYQCDVYVYQSDYGYECHVAGRRRDFARAGLNVPEPVEFSAENADAWVARHVAVGTLLDDERWDDPNFVGWAHLPEPYAGESYTVATAQECADLLRQIRAAGFNVPESVIEKLQQEAADETP